MGNLCSADDPCRCSQEQCIVVECGHYYTPHQQRDISNRLNIRTEVDENEPIELSPRDMEYTFKNDSDPKQSKLTNTNQRTQPKRHLENHWTTDIYHTNNIRNIKSIKE